MSRQWIEKISVLCIFCFLWRWFSYDATCCKKHGFYNRFIVMLRWNFGGRESTRRVRPIFSTCAQLLLPVNWWSADRHQHVIATKKSWCSFEVIIFSFFWICIVLCLNGDWMGMWRYYNYSTNNRPLKGRWTHHYWCYLMIFYDSWICRHRTGKPPIK